MHKLLAACVKWASLFCTCPSHSAPVQIRARVARFACFMSDSALYEWLWNIKSQYVSDEKARLLFLKISHEIYNEWFPALLQQNTWLQYWAATMEQL